MLYFVCWLGLSLNPSQGFVPSSFSTPLRWQTTTTTTTRPSPRHLHNQPSQQQQQQQRLFVTTVSSSTQPVENGLIKTITVPGQGDYPQLGDLATVKYTCYYCHPNNEEEEQNGNNSNNQRLSSSSSSTLVSQSSRQKVVVGDGTMIDGWDRALRTMRVGERSLIRIVDPTLAYGAMGVPPIVPPQAILELDLELLETQPVVATSLSRNNNIDLDALTTTVDAQTPTTAAGIAAAFAQRQAAKAAAAAQSPEKEGLDYWIDKARNFYFFGLFEGETGERPPWFLQPSITFPLAFVIVGAAFYVTLAGGAITERGAQVTDELDEIILSSTYGGSGGGSGIGNDGGDLLSPPTLTLLAMNGLLTTLLSMMATVTPAPPMDHLGL